MIPTKTTFAILGLVAAEPASAYELSKRMQLNYAYFWPSARSHVFAEVKKLDALGWVTGAQRFHGKRERTIYAITDTGRQALAGWLATPSERFGLEMESLVRLYLGSFGTPKDLAQAIGAMETEAEKMLAIADDILPAYLENRPPPPADELHVRALLLDFLAGFAVFIDQWAKRSLAEIAQWSDSRDQVDERATRTLQIALQATRRQLARKPR